MLAYMIPGISRIGQGDLQELGDEARTLDGIKSAPVETIGIGVVRIGDDQDGSAWTEAMLGDGGGD